MLTVNNFIFATGARSGETTDHRPDYFDKCTDANDHFCQSIGQQLAKKQGLAEWKRYSIDKLPTGYVGVQKVRDANAEKLVIDRYIFGHPKGRFISVPQFLKHYEWLQQNDESEPCPCDLCMKARNEGIGRRRPSTQVSEVETTNQYTTFIPGLPNQPDDDDEMTESTDSDDSTPFEPRTESSSSEVIEEEVVTFEFDHRLQYISQDHAVLVGELCTKAQQSAENGDLIARDTYLLAAHGAIYAGMALAAWFAMPELSRVESLDAMRAELTKDSLAETVKSDIRRIIQRLSSITVDTEPFYEHHELSDADIPAEHIETRDRLLDLVISEYGYQPFQPHTDCRNGVITLLESSTAPLALKLEVICMLVGGLARWERLNFVCRDGMLASFLEQLGENF